MMYLPACKAFPAEEETESKRKEEVMMKYAVIAIIFLITAYNTKAEDEYWGTIKHGSSNRIGNFEFYRDGTSSNRIGNFKFYSDGTSETDIGSFTFDSRGASSNRIGSHTFRSDGNSGQDIGQFHFYDAGKSITTIDGFKFTDDRHK